MTFDVRPAAVFEDVRALVGPKSPDANVCWCLSYRIPAKLSNELRGPARGASASAQAIASEGSRTP